MFLVQRCEATYKRALQSSDELVRLFASLTIVLYTFYFTRIADETFFTDALSIYLQKSV